MRAVELWILAYLLNSLWQVPLVFCAAWLAARLMRGIGARWEHRVWIAALLLQVLLPMCSFRMGNIFQYVLNPISWIRGSSYTDGVVRVVTGPARVHEMALLRLPAPVLWTIVTAYAGSVFYFAVQFAWGAWKTEFIRRTATVFEPTSEWNCAVAKLDDALRAKVKELQVATSERIAGPAMLGVWNQALLLPPGFATRLSEEELCALLGHELAHILRHDFAKNLLYGAASLPIAYHPLLWLTRARIAETRELVCDAMAAETTGGLRNYARSLLRLAAALSELSYRSKPGMIHAVGIFDTNNFERRVMRLTEKQLPIGGMRRTLIAALCLLVAFSTCVSALAWRMEVNAPPQKTVKRIAVAEKYLKLIHQVPPVYPPDALKAHVEGAVVLNVRIEKDGAVNSISTVKGPTQLQASARDAVKQWKYQPYLLNGNPIEVETQVTVIFTLHGLDGK